MPNPLHPAIVHFPIVLVFLLPILAGIILWTVLKGAPARRWAWVVGVAAALSLSAWVATRTGSQQEERVESVVAESAIETHEEAGEQFFILSLIVLALVGAGLAPGRIGGAGRIAGTVAAMLLIIAGWRVGDSGGKLVYTHGAAQAYVSTAGGGDRATLPAERGDRRRRGDDDDERGEL